MFNNKSILITGGTGTFGKAFTKYLLDKYSVNKICIYSRDEFKQSEMEFQFNHNEKLRFLKGDVRDKSRLYRAFNGIDIVIHAAAMKQVPACEYDPMEAIKTNIIGAMNVIDAAIDNKVDKVIALSTDKACLDYHSVVETDIGKIPISLIVKNKMKVNVKTFDGNEFVFKPITNWYKNKLSDRKLFKIELKTSSFSGKGKIKRLIATEDHPIMTKNGYKKVIELSQDDMIMTNELEPNEKQYSFLIGCILGDASIHPNKRRENNKRLLSFGCSVGFSNSKSQEEWVLVKNKILKNFNLSEVKEVASKHENRQNQVYFSLKTHRFVRAIYDSMYSGGVKKIPRELIEKYFSKEMIAAFYLDDGYLDGTSCIRIASCDFSYDDNVWLSEFLNKNGYGSYVYKLNVKNKEYYELRFTKNGSDKFLHDIKEFVPKCMQYKLYEEFTGFYNQEKWDLGKEHNFYDYANVTEYFPKTKKDVYCIDVKDTHNFIANNVIVHNCSPLNLYGATKMCSDKLFITANAYSTIHGTKFSLVRYGNVAGSRGSVIPHFEKMIKDGFTKLPVTDERMTRFWITIDQAVELVDLAVHKSKGGETFISKIPSFYVTDLVKAFNCEYIVTGIRPGEKLHEIMINESDAFNTYEYGKYFIVYPVLDWYDTKERLDFNGKLVNENFSYVSNVNEFMTVCEIQGKLLDMGVKV